MPPKKSKRSQASTPDSDASTSKAASADNEDCALCCQPIIEGEEEALLCEGDGCCNRWMHRYCAGVSIKNYGSLGKSPLPFSCSICVQLKQAAEIDEMKSTIAALTAEVNELRAALQATTSPTDNQGAIGTVQNSYSEVVRRRGGRSDSWKRNRSADKHASKKPSETNASKSSAEINANQVRSRVVVPGVRRVWGTMKNTSPAAVTSTLKKLVSNDLGKKYL